jgi:hypothetical protein
LVAAHSRLKRVTNFIFRVHLVAAPPSILQKSSSGRAEHGFQVFEGIDLHHTLHPGATRATEVLRLTKVHRLVLRLLGPAYENCYLTFQETAE